MELRPEALRFALAQGLPAEIEVVGGSMEPTLPRGTKVRVEACGAPGVGDVVLLSTDAPDVLILHRVLAVFDDGDTPVLLHQGDAPGAGFSVATRASVLGRVTSLERLPAPSGALFLRRRAVAEAFVVARAAARRIGVAETRFARAASRVFRALARRLSG